MSGVQNLPQWDINETRNLVHARYGAGQLTLLRPALRAVNYRLEHARYHHREYLRVVESHIETRLKTGDDIWWMLAPANDEEVHSHGRFYVECEAHLYACVQAIHAVADNLAHVVYYVLGFNVTNSPKLHKLNLGQLGEHISELRQSDASLATLADLLNGLNDSTVFKALNNLVNQLKHHGGPAIEVALQPSAEQAYEVRFAQFLRGKRWRAAVAVDQFLMNSFRVLNVAVVDVGIALNTCLQSASAPESEKPR